LEATGGRATRAFGDLFGTFTAHMLGELYATAAVRCVAD
jgi:hypothetical protein